MFVRYEFRAEDVEENRRHIPFALLHALGKRLVESCTKFKSATIFVENAREFVPPVRRPHSFVENCSGVLNQRFAVAAVVSKLVAAGRNEVDQIEQFAFLPELTFPLFALKLFKLFS